MTDAIVASSDGVTLKAQPTETDQGGLPGFYLADVSDSRIEGNSFHYSGAGPADGSVQIVGPFRNNVVRNNPGLGFPTRQ